MPFRRRRRRRTTAILGDTRTQNIQNLLNPPDTPLSELLRSRAIPNQRLVRAFGLTNTFVSESVDTHTTFRDASICLLTAAKKRGWKYFLNIADQAVACSLDDANIRFDTYIQGVTLRVVLVAVLDVGVDVDALESGDVEAVSALITELWNLSKKPEPIPPELLQQLSTRLRRLVPDETQFRNPLDYVIPTWETMWRVVATTVACVNGNTEGRLAFADLYDHPTIEQFRDRKLGGSGPSVEEWVKEIMRLYPPVRHIHRAIVPPPRPLWSILPARLRGLLGETVCIEQADIESTQRSPDVWGADAHTFNPARYLRRDLRAAPPSLAFGYGPLRCVAKDWAPMAAAIVVAAIMNGVECGTFELVRGKGVGGRGGWEGWSVQRR